MKGERFMKEYDFMGPMVLVSIVIVAVFTISKFSSENVSKAETASGQPVMHYTNLDLPPGMKLENAGFNNKLGNPNNLWFAVRPMREGELPETHEIVEMEWTSGHGYKESRHRFSLIEHAKGDTSKHVNYP